MNCLVLLNKFAYVLFVHRVPQLHERVSRLVGSDSASKLYYSIQGSKLKGRAVIINIKSFTGDQERRQGSDVDALNMLGALENLGFSVEVYENLTRDNFYKLIHALSWCFIYSS